MNSGNGRLAKGNLKILVVDNRSILGASMEKLLSSSGHIQIIDIVSENELELVHDIRLFSPDVIVLSDRSRLINPVRLISLLEEFHAFHLIVVSETDNTIEVYEKRQIKVAQHIDLINAVQIN